METLIQQLIRHEGLEKFPYKCSAGRLTIGVGRNIEDRGISENEAMFLLQNDIDECIRDLNIFFPVVRKLNKPRYHVIINMCFNIGISRLRGFKKMWKAIEEEDFNEAAVQMLDSKWAEQVGSRAVELADIMKKGE